MKFFTKEVQIALAAIVSIVVLYFGLQFLKGLSVFSNNNSYMVKFDDVSGMSSSSPVYANGFKVGVVEDVTYDYERPGNILAVIGLDKEMRLTEGTRAEIASDLLGNVKVELRMGDGNRILTIGDTILGSMQKGAMGKAADMLPQVEQMLPKLDSILASVNALLADPALRNSLGNVEQITANLTTTTNELHQLAGRLNKQVPGLMAKADGVLDNTNTLTHNLSELDVARTLSHVNATLSNVEQLTSRLNSKDGTLGLLMSDPSLYMNLNATMRDADSLMINLREHPKRYVHFSLFGRRDK
jgi:phospholipid/cholesterol/gamma-HCH transport system substrate-binding protein